MKLSVYAFAGALVLMGAVVTYALIRGESTRDKVVKVERHVTVDPCRHPESKACQRRIALVLRALGKRNPKALDDLGLNPREASGAPAPQGGGAANPPSGGGPVGRVPAPRPSPPPTAPDTPDPPAPPEPRPLLDAPLPAVCTDLVRVNC